MLFCLLPFFVAGDIKYRLTTNQFGDDDNSSSAIHSSLISSNSTPTEYPTTDTPSEYPTTDVPSAEPTTNVPTTNVPTAERTTEPSPDPTVVPSLFIPPSSVPTSIPSTTSAPSYLPSSDPTSFPTVMSTPEGKAGREWWYLVAFSCTLEINNFEIYGKNKINGAVIHVFESLSADPLTGKERESFELTASLESTGGISPESLFSLSEAAWIASPSDQQDLRVGVRLRYMNNNNSDYTRETMENNSSDDPSPSPTRPEPSYMPSSYPSNSTPSSIPSSAPSTQPSSFPSSAPSTSAAPVSSPSASLSVYQVKAWMETRDTATKVYNSMMDAKSFPFLITR